MTAENIKKMVPAYSDTINVEMVLHVNNKLHANSTILNSKAKYQDQPPIAV